MKEISNMVHVRPLFWKVFRKTKIQIISFKISGGGNSHSLVTCLVYLYKLKQIFEQALSPVDLQHIVLGDDAIVLDFALECYWEGEIPLEMNTIAD